MVRADRSLAGRLVCGRCGAALGIRATAGGGSRTGRPRRNGAWLGLAALLTLATVLAAQQQHRLQPGPQRPAAEPTPGGRV